MNANTATPTILPTSTREQILASIITLVDAGHRVRLGRWSLIKDNDWGSYEVSFIDDTPENRAGAKVADNAWWAEHDYETAQEGAEALYAAWTGDW